MHETKALSSNKPFKLPRPTSGRERFLLADPHLCIEKESPGGAVKLQMSLRPPTWRTDREFILPAAAPTRWYRGKYAPKDRFSYGTRVRENIERRAGFRFAVDGDPTVGLAITQPLIGESVLKVCASIASIVVGRDTNGFLVPLSDYSGRLQALKLSKEVSLLVATKESPLFRFSKKNGNDYVSFRGQTLFVLIRSGFNFGNDQLLTEVKKIAPKLILEELSANIERQVVLPSTTRRFAEYVMRIYQHLKRGGNGTNTTGIPSDSLCNRILLKATEIWSDNFTLSELTVMKRTAEWLCAEETRIASVVAGRNFRSSGSAFAGGGGFGHMKMSRSSCNGKLFS
jgi:hypothetical protein